MRVAAIQLDCFVASLLAMTEQREQSGFGQENKPLITPSGLQIAVAPYAAPPSLTLYAIAT